LTGHEWKRAPESPCGACPDRDGQLLQAPPTAEQREQQHLEEGQKFKQQVQKQRASVQVQRAACKCSVQVQRASAACSVQRASAEAVNVQWMTEFSRIRLSLIFLSALGQKLC